MGGSSSGQERVDQILELNASINKRRLPAKGDEMVSQEAFDLDWLYGVDFEATVQEILLQPIVVPAPFYN
ncbi:hypothetical protein EV126DRAFT_421833 [Verticillium dahliae]|nr:hypothetical protein EV126DRAFT_421833 [Verticillium dahliae]